MENKENDIIYSQQAIDFVRVANEFCGVLETTNNYSRREYVGKLQQILPLLYYRIVSLPKIESCLSDSNENFVTEEDWDSIHDNIRDKLGEHDEFLEVMDERYGETDYAATVSLSEYLSDIYQDIKDLIMLFRIGNQEIMHDALWEVVQNFEEFWGQKLSNALKAIHNLVYLPNLDEEEEA